MRETRNITIAVPVEAIDDSNIEIEEIDPDTVDESEYVGDTSL